MRVLELAVVLLFGSLSACSSRADLQCDQSASCNFVAGGMCSDPGTGNGWCAYPDSACQSGYRYSDVQVGDGVSGQCVVNESADAGNDAPNVQDPPVRQLVSCQGLAATCRGSESCCTSLAVPRGTFFRDYDLAGDSDSNTNANPATVSAFELDKYEVTVGRFRQFVAAGKGTQADPPANGSGAHTAVASSGWQAAWNSSLTADATALKAALKCDAATYNTWTDSAGALENRPINCVSWYEAMAFCIWDGGYLPTEAEWSFAATGGDEQRAYPWSAPASSLALDSSYAAYYDGSNCGPSGPACPGVVDVGKTAKGDGRWGHADLAGNVFEHVLDTLNRAGEDRYVSPCTDCARVFAGDDTHIMRGGSARDTKAHLRTSHRDSQGPRNRARDIGFRCARPVPN